MKLQRKSLASCSALYVLTNLIVCAFAVPSFADPAVPAQQSKCEVWANKWAAEHPNADPMNWPTDWFHGTPPPPSPPSTYRDPESGIIFYFESDGRHLAAIDRTGKLLWVRNPFVDSDLCPYRSAHPYISWIGSPGGSFGRHYLGPFKSTPDAKANAQVFKILDEKIARGIKVNRPKDGARFIGISFNSSQFGDVNIANGDFYFMGQN